jgi:hypothetical protein
MNKNKLLGCPFCGKEPEVDSYKIRGTQVWNVSCLNDDCLIHVETDDFPSLEESIKVWNLRISVSNLS